MAFASSICSFELLLKVLFKGSYLLVSSCSIFKVLCCPLGTACLLYHAQFRLSSTFFKFFQSLFQSVSVVPDGYFMLPYLVQFVNRLFYNFLSTLFLRLWYSLYLYQIQPPPPVRSASPSSISPHLPVSSPTQKISPATPKKPIPRIRISMIRTRSGAFGDAAVYAAPSSRTSITSSSRSSISLTSTPLLYRKRKSQLLRFCVEPAENRKSENSRLTIHPGFGIILDAFNMRP